MRITPLIKIAIPVILTCFALFSLDDDVNNIYDLIDWEIIPVLLIYCTPTIALCYIIYNKFTLSHFTFGRIAVALIVGIPIGFASIIAILEALKHFRVV